MDNLFSQPYLAEDAELVVAAQQGNRTALEELMGRHHPWIFNLALRMTGSPQDAEDVTQEILIKMLTRLATFQGKSSFRTWLYRIVTNHVINMKRHAWEDVFTSFESYSDILDSVPFQDPPEAETMPVDVEVLIEETKLSCLMGMLLCLDRTQRLVFILGAVFRVSSEIGAEIMEISPENFRQLLLRARKQLGNFINEKCGLLNPANPCRCARKTRGAIAAGFVDPQQLQFQPQYVQKIKAVALESSAYVEETLDLQIQDLFRGQPFLASPDDRQRLKQMLEGWFPV